MRLKEPLHKSDIVIFLTPTFCCLPQCRLTMHQFGATCHSSLHLNHFRLRTKQQALVNTFNCDRSRRFGFCFHLSEATMRPANTISQRMAALNSINSPKPVRARPTWSHTLLHTYSLMKSCCWVNSCCIVTRLASHCLSNAMSASSSCLSAAGPSFLLVPMVSGRSLVSNVHDKVLIMCTFPCDRQQCGLKQAP